MAGARRSQAPAFIISNMKRTLNKLSKIAILILCGTTIIGCNNPPAEPQTTDTVMQQENENYLAAISPYLTNEIGSQYAEAAYCIPSFTIIGIDETNPDDIQVWGDFWVFNYNLLGDTLKCVSGGSHPGLMHIQSIDNHYKVTAFDQVEDGSRNLPSAKRIFGDLYDNFHAINSNKEARDSVRLEMTAQYVQQHDIPVTMLQDFGWPAVKLPLK